MPIEGAIRFESFDSRPPPVFAEDAAWLSSRARETDDGTVFHLPTRHELELRNLYGFSETEWRSEVAFTDDCARFHAIGVRNRTFVRYPQLSDEIAPISPELIPRLRNIGWNVQQVQRLSDLQQLGDGIDARLKAAAGRLVSMPEFLAHRDRLRTVWNQLAETHRPEFPVYRSSQLPSSPDGFRRLSKRTRLARFLMDLDEFCDQWALQGLATWNLPIPNGPHWPMRALPSAASPDSCETRVRTPWHFPVRADDGLGDVIRNEHQRALRQHGIDDEARYETYARFVEIDHWQRVLTQRYRDRPRPRGFVTRVIGVVASTIGLEAERVAKLRKALRSLQTDHRNSLKGFR